jgi:hypothetical protein
MPDIEVRLRAAMHAAVDGEEAAPERLIKLVLRRHRRVRARQTSATVLAVLAIAASTVVAVHGAISRSPSRAASSLAPSPGKLPTRLSGLPMPAGMTVEFLVPTSAGAGWYSSATGRTEPISGLPTVAEGYQFERLAGGWAAWPVSYSSPCPENKCAGPPTTFYFIADGSPTATRIGTGYEYDGVDSGARAGTIWLVTYSRVNSPLTGTSFAQLVGTSGRPLGPRYLMPANYVMGRGIGRYLLLDLGTDQTHYELWDPATRRVLDRFDNVVAQGPEQVAWTRGCSGCRLEITNVSTGKTVITSIPDSSANLNAALSDDGRLLAVQVSGQELTIVSTATGSVTRIAGTALSTSAVEDFDWQNTSHRLIVTAWPSSQAGPDQIAYWQPGDTKLHVATIRDVSELPAIETGAF